MTQVYDALREFVFDLEIVDTHEHVPGREAARDMRTDVLAEYLTHYFSCDLVSAGLRPEDLQAARDSAKPLAKRWRLVEPYWEAARNTGYGRSLDIAARDLYGLPRIDRKTIGPLAEAFAAARAAGGTYENVLKKRSRIRLSILDSDLGCDPRYFRSTVRLDDFVTVATRAGLANLAQRAGVAGIHALEDLEDACEKALAHDLARGMACLKSGLAYERTLRYPKVPRPAAEADFAAIFAEDSFTGPTRGYTGALADHMMHHVCRLADARGLAFQFHTGIQEGNGNWVRHTDPSLLTDLFLEYPNVRFDCFHIGYPYQQTLAVLAKNFRNVFIDFSWAHIISPAASVAALVEYLDSVPANKISGFGGDYAFVDGIYGHQYMARENVARALALRVEAGACDLPEAGRLAKRILHDNPVAIFGLAGALKGGSPRKK